MSFGAKEEGEKLKSKHRETKKSLFAESQAGSIVQREVFVDDEPFCGGKGCNFLIDCLSLVISPRLGEERQRRLASSPGVKKPPMPPTSARRRSYRTCERDLCLAVLSLLVLAFFIGLSVKAKRDFAERRHLEKGLWTEVWTDEHVPSDVKFDYFLQFAENITESLQRDFNLMMRKQAKGYGTTAYAEIVHEERKTILVRVISFLQDYATTPDSDGEESAPLVKKELRVLSLERFLSLCKALSSIAILERKDEVLFELDFYDQMADKVINSTSAQGDVLRECWRELKAKRTPGIDAECLRLLQRNEDVAEKLLEMYGEGKRTLECLPKGDRRKEVTWRVDLLLLFGLFGFLFSVAVCYSRLSTPRTPFPRRHQPPPLLTSSFPSPCPSSSSSVSNAELHADSAKEADSPPAYSPPSSPPSYSSLVLH